MEVSDTSSTAETKRSAAEPHAAGTRDDVHAVRCRACNLRKEIFLGGGNSKIPFRQSGVVKRFEHGTEGSPISPLVESSEICVPQTSRDPSDSLSWTTITCTGQCRASYLSLRDWPRSACRSVESSSISIRQKIGFVRFGNRTARGQKKGQLLSHDACSWHETSSHGLDMRL